MKALILTTLALVLTACSSIATKQEGTADTKAGAAATRLAESTFDGTGGTLNLVFDDHGNWTKITANGTASLGEDTPSARRDAIERAPAYHPDKPLTPEYLTGLHDYYRRPRYTDL